MVSHEVGAVSAGARRTATIVFDTEMGWGSIENRRIGPRERDGVFERARDLLPRVVGVLDDRELPSTWAVVGALLDPDVRDRLGHLPSARADQIRLALDTHRRDTLHLPELGSVLAGSTGVEIGCHSWSHTRFDFPGLDREGLAVDLALWRESVRGFVDADRGVTMVCPRDTIGFVDVLAEAGVDALRVPPGYEGPAPGWARRLRWPRPSRAGHVDTPAGRVLTREGTLFFRPGGLRRVYSSVRARHALSRHPAAVLWLHPFNFGEDGDLFGAFVALLDDIARRRDAGVLDVRTLAGAMGATRG
jgi:peptidoglycan/xylan/chitin deacetylase (PgdA/CDA1 family)